MGNWPATVRKSSMEGAARSTIAGMVDQVHFDTGESSDSIDQLLSSALAEQSREKRMLADAVHSARDALNKAESELAQLKDLVGNRDETISEILLRVHTIEEWAHRVSAQIEATPQTVSSYISTSEELEVRIKAANDELLTDIREDQVEVVRALSRTFDVALAEVKQQLAANRQDYLDKLAVIAEQIVEKNDSTAELMMEHLTGYLGQRDETMHRAREQMLIDLFQRLGSALGRSGKKVAKAMGATAGARPAQPTPAPPPKFRASMARRSVEPPSPPPRRQMAPPRPQPEPEPGPIQLPVRESPPPQPRAQPRPDEEFDPDLDADVMTREELAREYLVDGQDYDDELPPQMSTRVLSEAGEEFFAVPERSEPSQMRHPDSAWKGGPPRDG